MFLRERESERKASCLPEKAGRLSKAKMVPFWTVGKGLKNAGLVFISNTHTKAMRDGGCSMEGNCMRLKKESWLDPSNKCLQA